MSHDRHPPGGWHHEPAAVVLRAPLADPPFADGPERPGARPPYPHLVDLADAHPDEIFRHGSGGNRRIALTFDDGPDGTWTPQIQRVLRQYGVPATFFCVGQMVQAYPSVVRALVRGGHVIGNHTWDHPHLPRLDARRIRQELTRTENAIDRAAGVRPRLFRPPYGQMDETVIQQAMDLDDRIILWNVDSLCWSGLTSRQIAANVLGHATPGAIVLMHSAGGTTRAPTVRALPRIIEGLKAAGYTFVTVPDLLGIPAYK
ncbi:polysaccharide deacetylase family protein [Alicyclobacillus sp.]|uniref:polysaccharide deacetylase family protein n=1 Tax=Alicyclobacillus sp. TaxID=61169 RepID=UPI0025BE32CD|nr:polysaccharide deacetylase family protein [Alicyclobacillus sp.]MCL6517810.1 polysaccharide deacetylase family protein [Alicyclobacillus sp.]